MEFVTDRGSFTLYTGTLFIFSSSQNGESTEVEANLIGRKFRGVGFNMIRGNIRTLANVMTKDFTPYLR